MNPDYISVVSFEGKKTNQPSNVTISADPPKVHAGNAFEVKLKREDDMGLCAIWWFGQNTGIMELNRAFWNNCCSAKTCEITWSVTIHAPGSYILGANAHDSNNIQFDTAYDMACTTVIVLE